MHTLTRTTPRIPSLLASAALLGLVACAGGGKSDGGSSAGGTTTSGGNPTLTCPTPGGMDPKVSAALTTGNALTGATADDIITATLAALEAQRTEFDPLVARLYNFNADGTAKADGTSLTSVSWDPRHDCALLAGTFGENVELLTTNETTAGAPAPAKALAVAGETEGKARYLVLGTNPFRTNPARNNSSEVNPQMDQLLVNSVQWLTGKPAGTPFKIVLFQLDESTWFADESATRTWLTAKFGANVSFNTAKACDGASFSSCLASGADLVIVSQRYDATTQDPAQLRDAVKGVLDAGKPVLYFNQDGGPNALGSLLLDLFKVQYAGDNYWSHYRATAVNGASAMGRLSTSLTAIREMLTRLKSGTYDFTLATATTSPAYQTQFQAGASAVRAMMNGLDASRKDLFATCGNEIPKLLALLGDRLRQDIVYPMSVDKTSPREFLRAYYADHAVYTFRKVVPAQKDLGSFSSKDLSSVTPIRKTVELASLVPFRAAGVYALPGRTVKVTRLDGGSVTVRLTVNSLRAGSTHEWDKDGYTRPKFLSSQSILVKPGETITFTHPYGGPIQIGFDANDVPVKLQFENVGQHAFWASHADDASFAQALGAAQFDWAELAAASFEVHSKLDRFKGQTMTGALWDTPATLATATMTYAHNYTNLLAGFQGDGIEVEPEVHGWAAAKGLAVSNYDHVKHVNADQATCGYACSGNPFDRWGAFGPIHFGDLHEVGHGLQSGRMLLSTGSITQGGHGATNFYAEYARERFYENTGRNDSGDGLSNSAIGVTDPMTAGPSAIFKALVGCSGSPDPGAAMEQVMVTALSGAAADATDQNFDADPATASALAGMSYGYNYAVFGQMMMQARKREKLNVGHHLIARLHILERQFNAALKDSATWEARKGALGFSAYTFDQAKAISNNEWVVIAASFAVELDFRSLMTMMGTRFGALADAQVASFHFTSTGKEYLTTNNANAAQFKGSRAYSAAGTPAQVKTTLITPTATWPW